MIDPDQPVVTSKVSATIAGHTLEYTYNSPLKPNLSRWWQITSAFKGGSVLRMLQYEHLAQLPLSGEVLDLGGGQKAKYLTLLPSHMTLRSVNIDPGIAPTHLVQPGQPLPFDDNSFDSVICLNTLEHIYDSAAVLADLHRVVRPGGAVHVTVPFMFRIHGHPDDYLRATPSWWRETFRRAGFARMELTPLVWGRFSTAAVVPGFRGFAPRSRLHWAMFKDVFYAWLHFKTDRMHGRKGESIASTSPGWFMTAIK